MSQKQTIARITIVFLAKDMKCESQPPEKEGDGMSDDYWMILGALASCAIEGNEEAIRILNLQKTDPEQFFLEVEKISRRQGKRRYNAPT